jgi:hypothetical protein
VLHGLVETAERHRAAAQRERDRAQVGHAAADRVFGAVRRQPVEQRGEVGDPAQLRGDDRGVDVTGQHEERR